MNFCATPVDDHLSKLREQCDRLPIAIGSASAPSSTTGTGGYLNNGGFIYSPSFAGGALRPAQSTDILSKYHHLSSKKDHRTSNDTSSAVKMENAIIYSQPQLPQPASHHSDQQQQYYQQYAAAAAAAVTYDPYNAMYNPHHQYWHHPTSSMVALAAAAAATNTSTSTDHQHHLSGLLSNLPSSPVTTTNNKTTTTKASSSAGKHPSKSTAASGRSNCVCPNCNEAERLGVTTHKRHNCHVPGCGKIYEKSSHLKAHLRWHSDSHAVNVRNSSTDPTICANMNAPIGMRLFKPKRSNPRKLSTTNTILTKKSTLASTPTTSAYE